MFDKSWNEWVNKEFITSLKAKGKLPNNLTLAQEQKRREFQKTDRVFPQPTQPAEMPGDDADAASTPGLKEEAAQVRLGARTPRGGRRAAHRTRRRGGPSRG